MGTPRGTVEVLLRQHPWLLLLSREVTTRLLGFVDEHTPGSGIELEVQCLNAAMLAEGPSFGCWHSENIMSAADPFWCRHVADRYFVVNRGRQGQKFDVEELPP